MAARAKFIDKDRGWAKMRREIDKARRKPHVAVGIFGAEAARDHDGVPNVRVAAAHELGLTIKHPGGTAYIMGSDGRPKFISNAAAAGKNLPRTKPHTIQMPERSFIRGTIDVKQRAIANLARNLFGQVLVGELDTRRALGLLGLFIEGEIKKRISRGIPPPLKAATIKRKGSSTPLIDSGQLRASVGNQVRNA